MTDVPFEGGAGPDEAGEPVRELAALREEPSEQFMGRVMDGIHLRQTGANAVELGWWGVTRLCIELLESFLHAVGVHGEPRGKE